MDRDELLYEWLREENEELLEKLFSLAEDVRSRHVGDEVHLRGLIEFSNECVRNCTYCGIRIGNSRLSRYRMSRDEILDCSAKAYSFGYGTVVLQSGEDDGMTARWLAEIIKAIKGTYPLAVTLSVGERPLEDYRLWRKSGADRYLLKFETSDEDLFNRIHPPRRRGEPNRMELLVHLRELGYEIGGGIMVGLPGQTYSSLAQDIETFAELDLDMIGIGPYVPHPDTPLGREYMDNNGPLTDQVPNNDLTTYKVIALTRIMCPEANIPATTALATVAPLGFEGGLKAGANVIMPNLTPLKYRKLYEIYPTTFYQSSEDINDGVLKSIMRAGRTPARGRGDRRRKSGSQRMKSKEPDILELLEKTFLALE